MTIRTANLGFPRIGRHRELKFALEAYWAGKSDREALFAAARKLRADNWKLQRDKGIDVIPSNDFSLYDHVLDTAVMVGAIPERYGWTGGPVDLDTYFAMARGSSGDGHADCGHAHHDHGVPALEMTKWFDTNYHYLVPEFDAGQRFELTRNGPLETWLEAKALGIETRPVLLGPITFLKLGKASDGSNALDFLGRLLPVYIRILSELSAAGVEWVQMDEPCLALDLTEQEKAALRHTYAALKQAVPNLSQLLAVYFGQVADNFDTVVELDVDGVHLDLVRGGFDLERLAQFPDRILLSLGVVDGRNIWRSDLGRTRGTLNSYLGRRDNIELSPSCSLIHVPVDLGLEVALDEQLKSWLSFATQKLEELALLRDALLGREGVETAIRSRDSLTQARLTSSRVHDPIVAGRLAEFGNGRQSRKSEFPLRRKLQRQRFGLPDFPTTTIGSFPQTPEVRKARSAHARGELSYMDYVAFLERETAAAIRWQEDIGLDVLVHGEFERNDMVQYFGEQLSGFAFTQHAWVQSYGSRYVRPPIIFGDVSRPNPMTVRWWQFAQSIANKPVKAMLTGPVTILNWSFVRDDVPRNTVCRQIALAIRDEVLDLEAAGAAMIQIDEAALRERLPLRRRDWQHYLDWAVDCFRICSAGVADQTQIHTHMCYSEFNDIMSAIAAMDADVISIETSRSKMELLDAFTNDQYPNEIGPGVYDIHSPRVPSVEEIEHLLGLARQRLSDEQLWVNPDCGLKTRKWEEVKPALVNMVAAAQALRRASISRPIQRVGA
jgi:5-methyltetrahydropteroyltriglutamate--homocysteine methyltransferase